jgi:large subunit ribosomal protein L33
VTTKNKKTTTERLEFKKFCRRCHKHINHKETK